MAISSSDMPSGAKISPRSGSVRSQGPNVPLKSGSSWILASQASGEGCRKATECHCTPDEVCMKQDSG